MAWQPSLTQLRVFIQVARLGNFTEAARNLNLSQPALSRTIRMLESQFGEKLFDRDTRNVALTAPGQALYSVSLRLLGDFDLAFSELSETFAGQRGRVVVGAMPSLAAGLLPRIIADFRVGHPRVSIVVRDTLSGTIEDQFQQANIDLAVIAPMQNSDAYHFTPLMDDEFGLVCRASEAPVNEIAMWDEFREQPFIAMAPGSSVRFAADGGLSRAGVSVNPRYECAHVSTVGAMIEAGLGASALPRSTLGLLGSRNIVWRRLESPSLVRVIGLAQVAHRPLSPAALAFAAAVLAHCQAGEQAVDA